MLEFLLTGRVHDCQLLGDEKNMISVDAKRNGKNVHRIVRQWDIKGLSSPSPDFVCGDDFPKTKISACS